MQAPAAKRDVGRTPIGPSSRATQRWGCRHDHWNQKSQTEHQNCVWTWPWSDTWTRGRHAWPQDSVKCSLPSSEHRHERRNSELQRRVILNPNPVMIVQKGRERRRIMNITPKQFKSGCVLEGAKTIGKTWWGPTDLPHPIKKRHCKAFVANNRVQIFTKNQIRQCTNLTHLVDYDWLTHLGGVLVICKDQSCTCLKREQVFG